MKKILFFIFIYSILQSQEVTKVTYQTNELNTKYKSELYHSKLKNESIFINYKTEIKPGTAYINEQNQIVGEMIDYEEEYFKDFNSLMVYSDANIKYITKDVLKEPIQFNWIIDHKDTKEILGYKCYKATTQFRGRNYIAYFSDKIETPDGPRKFSGLPGLILELREESGMLYVIATEISNTNKEIKYARDITKADFFENLIEKAKGIYHKKKSEIEEKYNSTVQIDFSKNLEIYDLN